MLNLMQFFSVAQHLFDFIQDFIELKMFLIFIVSSQYEAGLGLIMYENSYLYLHEIFLKCESFFFNLLEMNI